MSHTGANDSLVASCGAQVSLVATQILFKSRGKTDAARDQKDKLQIT